MTSKSAAATRKRAGRARRLAEALTAVAEADGRRRPPRTQPSPSPWHHEASKPSGGGQKRGWR